MIAFVYVMARISLLGVALLAIACITSRGVYAILLAQMISGCAFVQISAANTVGIQDETRRARADEATLGVLTIVLARYWR